MPWSTRLFCALSSLLLMGCGQVSFRGDVGDTNMGKVRSVGFDTVQMELPVWGQVNWMVLVFSDAQDACEAVPGFGGLNLPADCSERCDAYVDLLDRSGIRKDESWGLTVALNAIQEGFETTFPYNSDFVEGSFVGDLEAWQLSYIEDPVGCEEACLDGVGVPADYTAVSGGEVEITRHDPDELLKGKLDLAFGLDQVRGSFHAQPCDLSAWNWWGEESL